MEKQKIVSLKETRITGIGDRLLHLKELLAFKTVSEFTHFLMVNPGTIQRLITRNPNNTATISTETLYRIMQKVPNLNVNWLLTGGGTPLVDQDALYLMHTAEYYRKELANIQEQLEVALVELKEATKQDKLPSTTTSKMQAELQAAKSRTPKLAITLRLGNNEKILIKEMLESKAWIRKKANTFHVMSQGEVLYNLPKRDFSRLSDKGIFVLTTKDNYNKFLINPKFREQLKYIVNN